MMIKSCLALFLVSTSFASAGSVRGVARREETNTVTALAHRRLETLDSWLSTCDTGDISACVGDEGLDGCTQCIYSQSLLSSSTGGVKNCVKFLCNECEDQAMAFYECGIARTASLNPLSTTPGVGVSEMPDPSLVTPNDNAPSVTETTTSEGCPLILPEDGADCTGLIPEPFKYHKCYYREEICSCRKDSPFYICSEREFTARPTPVPTLAPPPTPAPVEKGVSVCSDDIMSGARCAVVGLSCCVGGKSQCVCGSDNFFVCQKEECGVQEDLTLPDSNMNLPETDSNVTLPEVDSNVTLPEVESLVEETPLIEEKPEEDLTAPEIQNSDEISLFDPNDIPLLVFPSN